MKSWYDEVIKLLDEDKAVDILKHSLQMDTTNPPGSEKVLAQYLADVLNSFGLKSHIDDLGNERGNVVGCIPGSGEKKGLLLNGHLDVVPPGAQAWTYGPFSGVIDAGKLYGRGASDMKSGLAALVVAAGLIAQAGVPLKGDLLITGTAGEEADSLGAKDLLTRGYLQNIGAAIIGEPSLLKLFAATKGALWLEFTTVGKTAHGSMPECGANAVLMMNAIINKLVHYSFQYSPHPLLGEPSMNIATIQGGVKTNVVPDSCKLTVDIRTVPGQDHSQIINDIQKILDELEQTNPDFKASFTVLNNRAPVETNPEAEIIQMSIQEAKTTLGIELKPCGVKYYTDASVFVPALDIPVLILGPGDETMAHQPNEYVEIKDYIAAIKLYVAVILRYLM
ncbi:M20 family metallopeptidase [Desulfitobacterium sp. Sab5]|uniref:M20 family metallopeptidase n=1 Tax=Desulfitobacterium nosdiversum TaxID=3375356 RepID=UPI003CF7267E